MNNKIKSLIFLTSMSMGYVFANEANSTDVSDEYIVSQRETLAKNTEEKGYPPQAPRDIDSKNGYNKNIFGASPDYKKMNLCNIHFHKNAEHKGGEFTKYAGNGDGKGNNTGYKYSGNLSKEELISDKKMLNNLAVRDTIEIHYVFSTAKAKPGPTLGSCLTKENKNPQLRVESVVSVLVADKNTSSLIDLAKLDTRNGYHQAINIPNNLGTPVKYSGSTTGPKYNEKPSPFQVYWSVRPKVLKVNIDSVNKWLDDNIFDENHAHGSRNLVKNPKLLSGIK